MTQTEAKILVLSLRAEAVKVRVVAMQAHNAQCHSQYTEDDFMNLSQELSIISDRIEACVNGLSN